MNKFITILNNYYKKHYDFIKYLGKINFNFTLYLTICLLFKIIWLKIYQFIKLFCFIYYAIKNQRYIHILIFLLIIISIKYTIQYYNSFYILFFIISIIKIYIIDYIQYKKNKYLTNKFHNFLVNYQFFLDNKIMIIYKYINKKIY